MDGKAISIGISTSPGPDWLKDVVRKVGLRLKVHKELRQLLLTSSSRIQRGNEPVSPPMFSPPSSALHTRSLSPFSGSVSRNVFGVHVLHGLMTAAFEVTVIVAVNSTIICADSCCHSRLSFNGICIEISFSVN